MSHNYPPALTALAEKIMTAQHTWTNEAELQASIDAALKTAGYSPTREVALSSGLGRVDLMVGKVGIEVKIAGSWQQLTRQVMRYTHAPEIGAVLVVTTKAAHARNVPVQANGKPILTIFLNGAF
ncbi:Cas4 family exonuclease [Arthrobacter phage Colucci]|uniref:Cas4 family exonuclease n=1 Tax=Arthrobacter phage Colucci TaxID=2015834 RepID=A0A286N304_9CAUD|nr:PD-(D/E) XK-like restriction enzyme [Arthrobacter phage Colucci]ASX98761.1 Cas4 family exonuclease [Arthrobacter phage Colucci]